MLKGINAINQIPTSTVKCSWALMLMEQMEKDINIELNLDYIFNEINKIIHSNLAKKRRFFAPLPIGKKMASKLAFILY